MSNTNKKKNMYMVRIVGHKIDLTIPFENRDYKKWEELQFLKWDGERGFKVIGKIDLSNIKDK